MPDDYTPAQLRKTMEDWEARQREILEAEQNLQPQTIGEGEAALARMMGYQQRAQEVGPLGAFGLGLGRNFQNRQRGFAESGMMGARETAPLLQSLGVLRDSFPMEQFQGAIDQRLEEARREQAADEEIYAAPRAEHPKATGLSSLLTFGAELALLPKGIKANKAHPWQTAGRRAAQEGPIGALYGLSVPTMSDEQKMFAIAGGALTGTLAAGVFTGAGRLAQFTPETKESIARFMRLEKLFDKSGILTMGEMMSHGGLQKLEAALDNIPFFGLGRTRRLQRQAFRDMTESFLERMYPRQTAYLGTKNGQELVEELSQRIYNQFQKNRETVNFHYTEVARILDDVPRGAAPEVRLTGYRAAANRLLAQEKNRLPEWRNDDLIRDLEKVVGGEPHIPWKTARNSLSAIKESARIEAKKVANAEVTRERRAALVELEMSLIDDMGEFAKGIKGGVKGQDIMQQLQAANDAYSRLLLPFYKATDIGDLVGAGDFAADSVAGSFLSIAAPRGKSRVTPTRSPAGRTRAGPVERTDIFAEQGARAGFHPTDVDVARYMILRESLERASHSGGKTATGRIDPQRFAKELESMSEMWGVTFTGPQRELLEGYTDILRQAFRSFERQSAIGPLITGGAAAAALGSAAPEDSNWLLGTMATLAGARFFLGTKIGIGMTRNMRNAFLQGADSKATAVAMERAQTAFTRWMAGYYPEMFLEANPEFAESGIYQHSPFKGVNPMTQGIMGAEPMFPEETE
jgi:hypothetical protein